uniref:Uncharacterized immunity region protein 10 n=1 Tax=Bacillus phage phi105 TaxID=10717 RepID=YIMA_BPPH1|nr:RecName: Full=Uncharacterized immunity region protein 10 [Bacillus phage phi105]AAA88400.1 unknown protein [Bacillus phage phi105]prf//1112178B ORF 10 [Bacillus phage phi105]
MCHNALFYVPKHQLQRRPMYVFCGLAFINIKFVTIPSLRNAIRF